MLKIILCYKVKKGLRMLSNLATLYGSGAASVMRDMEQSQSEASTSKWKVPKYVTFYRPRRN